MQNQIAALLGEALFDDVERHATQRFAAMNGLADGHDATVHAGYLAKIYAIKWYHIAFFQRCIVVFGCRFVF